VTSASAEFLYKTTDYYAPEHERSLLWNDVRLAIPWPLSGAQPLVKPKDAAGAPLAEADCFD
jgi:dTDP-4-dehydrorhamnose 3,5-epimerase